jgi:hypothetical protein
MKLLMPGARLASQALAVVLLLAVAAFCLVSGAPMAAADAGCDGHFASGKVCGQSGPLQPLVGVIPYTPLAQRAEFPAAWLAIQPYSERVLQVQASPSSPRAPPPPIH